MGGWRRQARLRFFSLGHRSLQPQKYHQLFSAYNSITMTGPAKQRKIAIVGSRSVGQYFTVFPTMFCCTHLQNKGKSSLTVQFVDGHFVESYYPTIENTFSKNIKYKGQEYTTEIIDTAGQVGRGFLFCPAVSHALGMQHEI